MLLRFQPQARIVSSAYTIKILTFTASIVGPVRAIEAVQSAFPSVPCWPHVDAHDVPFQFHIQCISDNEWHLIEHGASLHRCQTLSDVQSMLVWLVNSKAVEWIGKEHLLFHAGSIAAGQSGIILPARSGSGKSTLTTALVSEGCSYFSDEAAVIDMDSGLLLPFPKAIKLEPDSLPVLASRFPELAAIEDHSDEQRQSVTYLCPPDVAWPSGPATPKLIIFPHYVSGAQTRMVAIPRTEAFERLMAHSFSAGSLAADGVHQVVRLVQGCSCYTLTVGDLDDAVKQIMLLTE